MKLFMRRFAAVALTSAACAGIANAQGRPLDWPFYGGDAQRTGWEKSDIRITKDNVKDFQLVLKRKLDNKQNGPRSLTPPVVIGLLISYRGFKELAFVAGNSDNIWSIDVDTDRMFWQKHFDYVADNPRTGGSSPLCSGSVTVTPSLTPPTNFAARPRPAAPPAAGASTTPNPARAMLGSPTFGSPRPAFALSSDGKLHLLNTSNGDDVVPAMSFIPANARASSLVISEGAMYTTTSGGCGGAPNAVWAIDLAGDAKVVSFPLNDGAPALGGLAFATDGTLYTQSGGKLLALAPKTLELKQSFTAPGGGSNPNPATPVVFSYKERDLVVSASPDGRLYVLDGHSLDNGPLSATPQITSSDHGIWGGLSSWLDADGVRWVLAPVWGPVSSGLNVPVTNGAAPNGSIVAFKLEDVDGKPTLTPSWVSRDMSSPEPPVITSGMVFALSAGEYGRDERPKSGSHATLYALDGATGKEMYSTGNQVTAAGNLTGITIANGRVYFTTNDSVLYAFGIYLER